MKNIKIVIIEDEMIVAKDLERTLQLYGYDVLAIFSSGEEFLIQIDQLKPDLILMDIILNGELNGIQTAGIINETNKYPIIFITAHAEKEKLEEAKKVGSYGYLIKPFNVRDLENTIEITLNKQEYLKKIEENEKRFQAIVDNSQNGIIISDLTGNIIFKNSKAKTILYQFDKILNTYNDIKSLIGEADWKKFQTRFVNTDKKNLNTIINLKKSSDKEELRLDVFCNKIDLEDNQNLVFHFSDITVKYNSLRNLRMLATAIRSIDECLYITDEDNNLLYINQTFCEKFEYDFHEIIGKDIFQLIYRSLTIDKQYQIQSSLETTNWSGEIEVITKNYKKIPAFVTISIIHDELKFIVGVVRDITDELMLKKQINQVQRLESIGILAGGVAHDFNNLLSIISGYSDLMLSKMDKTDKYWDFLNEIHKAGDKAANLTRQLLLFSKTNPGEITVMNINESIDHLTKMLNRIIGENITLTINLAEDIYYISADKGQLDQILMNLAVNARDAIHENTKSQNQITISTENIFIDKIFTEQNIGLNEGHYIKLVVQDSGKGIPEENLDKIFDPFFTTKGIDHGTGLGLSTVYGIVKKFNGAIFVESKIDEGTKFSIYFPKTLEECEQDSTCRKSIKIGTGTILVIEDSLPLLHLSEKMLDSLGYTIYSADNGNRALELSQQHRDEIDLIFADLIMPEYNGIDLYNEIKKIIPKVKVLYTSGYDDDFLEQHNMEFNSENFIRKPFEIQKLSKKISNLIETKSPSDH